MAKIFDRMKDLMFGEYEDDDDYYEDDYEYSGTCPCTRKRELWSA
ncbi:MAG: hypothetical protein V8Q32_00110 [Anaerotignum faecicola]